jgi:gluconokinase
MRSDIRVREVIDNAVTTGAGTVVACSALKAQYRAILAEGLADVSFVFLHTDRAILSARLDHRAGHFAGSALLDSQLQTLALPRDGLVLDASLSVDRLVDLIVAGASLQP